MGPFHLLVVDDDPILLLSLKNFLARRGYEVTTASTGQEAIEQVKQNRYRFALVILDYGMPDKTGHEIIKEILAIHPTQYILMFSGNSSRDALKDCWQAGAMAFIEKASPPEVLLQAVEGWCQKFSETQETILLDQVVTAHSVSISSIGLIGASEALAQVAQKVIRYRPLKEPVLILGETGTGKEKVAAALHEDSETSFFAVNCASFASDQNLMESELFGYVKGAFTGADKDKMGIFEAANNGTVYLDEIHTLDKKAQLKLLRVLQEKKIRPVGSPREYKVNFRLVSSAKPELIQNVEEGTFLPDLYERINGLQIKIPSLRDRKEDIAPLVAFFTERYEKETGEKKKFLKRTLQFLEQYHWPRNVRELENTVRRLCIDVEGEVISPDHLEPYFFLKSSEGPSNFKYRKTDQELRTEIEKALKINASKRAAARMLNMPESTLRRMIKSLEIQVYP